ncbi:MAG: N-acetylmuramidase domain-containing protein [Alphaproteobacteria bacterium]
MAKAKPEFTGKASKITDKDFQRAATRLGCDETVIRAVSKVESGGNSGFLKDKRPKILFESRWFHKLTDGQYDDTHPDISTPTWVRNYRGGALEYERLAKALKLHREAALKSASWGMFQILGANHAVVGFPTAEKYVQAQLVSEGAHLDAFVGFVITNRLDDELRDRRWADFARGYNGPAFRQNRYDEKLAVAYENISGGRIAPSTAEVQIALNSHGAGLVTDGITGPATRDALRGFQHLMGLAITGLADSQTLAALGLGDTHDPISVSTNLNT